MKTIWRIAVSFVSLGCIFWFILIARVPLAAKELQTYVPPKQNTTIEQPKTAQEQIVYYSRLFGVNETIALCIARMESGFNPTARNSNSTATGVFQFIRSTWLETTKRMGEDWPLADRLDQEKNIKAGVWLMSQDGFIHWVVAPKCL